MSLAHLYGPLHRMQARERRGQVIQYIGLVIEAHCPQVFVGEICYVLPRNNGKLVQAEVVGFRKNKVE